MAAEADDPPVSSSHIDHDHLIYEIETSDTSSVGLVIRAIYESGEQVKFMELLDGRIKNHDRDIEKMCNFYYQGFIDSIRELLGLRNSAESLKSDVIKIDDSLHDAAQGVIKQATEVAKSRTALANIASAVSSLESCLPVLQTYAKLQRQMAEKRYYPALKTLDQLEHVHLRHVAAYRFSQSLMDNIPNLRQSIQDAAMTDLRDFLESIRRQSSRIGQVAMRQAAEQSNLEWVFQNDRSPQKSLNPFLDDVQPLDVDNNVVDEELSAQDLVDFSPVYRCLHIYSVLGAKEEFETYYRKQRRKQARLVLQPPTNMHETIEGYRSYFQGIVGFFVVENHVLVTSSGLVTRAYLDELWEMAVSRIMTSLRTHSAYCTDSDLMLKIKSMTLVFGLTLQGYGFPTSQLWELLLEIRDQYNEILMKRWVAIFRKIFDEDTYHPISVEKLKDYQAVIEQFPFSDKHLQDQPFPRKFPFSQFVPQVYVQVKEFVRCSLKFSEDLGFSQTEVDDLVRKSTNILLTRTLSGCLSTLIRKPSLGLLQLIQITINANYLEQACIHLEEFISSLTGMSVDGSHIARLQGRSMFKDMRADAESQIYISLNRKIDEFLELATYDWLLPEPDGHASNYLVDLIAFLKSTFQAFTNLPDKVAKTACMSACKHIAQGLQDLLLQEEVRQLSMGALQQLNLDLIQCEVFAGSDPVHGFEEGALPLCFSELRQLLDLFLAWDWATYFHDYGQDTSKYLRVNPNAAIALLEKLREADKKNVFTVLKKSERDKKKLLDTVLKQLRQLTVNGAS